MLIYIILIIILLAVLFKLIFCNHTKNTKEYDPLKVDGIIGIVGGKKIKGGIIDRSHLVNYADTCVTISFLQLISNSYQACENIIADYVQNSKFDKKLIDFIWDAVDPNNNVLHVLLSKYPNSKNKFKSIEELIIPLYAAYLIIIFNYSHYNDLFKGKIDLITRYISMLNLIIMSSGDKTLYMRSSKKNSISINDLGIYGGSSIDDHSTMYNDQSVHTINNDHSSMYDNMSAHTVNNDHSSMHDEGSSTDDHFSMCDNERSSIDLHKLIQNGGASTNLHSYVQNSNGINRRFRVHGGSDGLDKLSERILVNMIDSALSLVSKLKNKSLLETADALYYNVFAPVLKISYVYRTSLVSSVVNSDVLKTFSFIPIKENESIDDHLHSFNKPDIMLVNERYTNIKSHTSHVNNLYESFKKSYGDYKVTDMLLTAYTTEGTLFRHMVYYNVLTETISDNSFNINVTLDELKIDFNAHRNETNINEAFFTYDTILVFSPVFIHLQKVDKDLENTLEYQSKNCSPYLRYGYEKGYSQFMYAKKFMEKLKRSNLRDSETKKEMIKLHEYLYGNPYVKVWRSVNINTWKYTSIYGDIARYIMTEMDRGALDEDDELLELINLTYKEKKSYTLQEAFKRLDS